MMRRHELDPVSLTFGFILTGLGLLFLFGRADQALRLHWLWPLLLLVLGAAILLDTARSRNRPDPGAEPARDLEAEPAVDNEEQPI
jgi:cytochrome c-type biogenesis protein CcmH/NrfF